MLSQWATMEEELNLMKAHVALHRKGSLFYRKTHPCAKGMKKTSIHNPSFLCEIRPRYHYSHSHEQHLKTQGNSLKSKQDTTCNSYFWTTCAKAQFKNKNVRSFANYSSHILTLICTVKSFTTAVIID